MQNITLKQASLLELDAITTLEQKCFPIAEAASRETFSLRLRSFPECFWLAKLDGQIIAMINGMTTNSFDLTDVMYEDAKLYHSDGTWLMLFGVETAPAYQKHGVASQLMSHVIERMKQQGRNGIVLTCKKELLSFYQRFGFINEGISDSVHGGAVWYQMRLNFHDELFRCVKNGEECSFYVNGRRYLLYSWRQCDGDYTNVSDENGMIIWQTTKSGEAAYTDFIQAYKEICFYK